MQFNELRAGHQSHHLHYNTRAGPQTAMASYTWNDVSLYKTSLQSIHLVLSPVLTGLGLPAPALHPNYSADL